MHALDFRIDEAHREHIGCRNPRGIGDRLQLVFIHRGAVEKAGLLVRVIPDYLEQHKVGLPAVRDKAE